MNKVDKNSCFNSLQACGEFIKETGEVVVQALAIIVFAVAHPIIGPAGSIGCLFAAGYHGVLTNYHWRHSREKDQNGNLIPETELSQLDEKNLKNYMDKDARFEPGDLVRLQNEVKRKHHTKALTESLKWARGLAKCTIPIAGPIWAICSEMETGGVSELNFQHDDHQAPVIITPEQMLSYHIKKLKSRKEGV